MPEPLDATTCKQFVLDKSSDQSCRDFWTQRDRPAPAILKGVHFLTNHIGGFADASGKQLGLLKHGRADFAVGGAAKNLVGDGFDLLPDGDLAREDVAGAANGLDGAHGLGKVRMG